MPVPENPLAPEELLSHVGWMRSLARSLAADESQAEDLVQETLAAAVERPPRQAGAARAWLGVVLRNFFHRSRKSELSRRRREQAAARPERVWAGPLEVLEQAELQRRLVELVFELEEPFRSTVLLRYFEDLNPSEVAGRLGVDATTVRWRLRRAHQRLRERLDRSYGARGAWLALALALPAAGTRAAALAAPAASIPWPLFGVLAMKLKVTALLAALALSLIALFLVLRLTWEPPPTLTPAPRAGGDLGVLVPSSAHAEPEPSPSRAARRAAAAVPAPAEEPAGPAVRGVVVDLETGEPIARAVVAVRDGAARAETDDQGAYQLAGLPPGEHFLIATAQGHAEENARVVLAARALRKNFGLDPAIELHVTVKDEEGKPIAGVEVTPAQPAGDYRYGPGVSRHTDESGEASIPGISRLRAQQINARKEGYHEVWTEKHRLGYGNAAPELEIVMKSRRIGERWVQGLVTDREGRALPGVQVQWIHSHGEHRGRSVASSDAQGSYRLSFTSDDRSCRISAFAEGWAPEIREGVKPGTLEEPGRCDFSLEAGHRLDGTVVDEEGRPVAGATVAVMPSLGHLRNPTVYPGIVREAETDERGAFRLSSLPGPQVALKLLGPRDGGKWGNNMHPKVEVDRRLELVLKRYGVVRGWVADRETGEPVRSFNVKLKKGAGYYAYARCDPGESFDAEDGRFLLLDLDQEPTTFTVEAEGYLPTRVSDALPAAEQEVQDLEVVLTRGEEIEGIVVDAASGRRVGGVEVIFGVWEWPDPPGWNDYNLSRLPCRQQMATAADGAFRFQESEPGVLFLKAAGYARAIVVPEGREGLADKAGRLRVRLQRPGSLRGVHTRAGKPCASGALALFELRPPKKPGEEPPKVWIGNLERDLEGRFHRQDLTPGRYRLELYPERKEASKTERRPSFRSEIEVPAGGEALVEVEEAAGE